jgi:cellulose synthase/poly-beta-1,6-N-acetylglucosamine synthase-like glycosyltransferase
MWLNLLFLGMAAHLAVLLLLYAVGAPAVRAARGLGGRPPVPPPPVPQPSVAMIVPLTGDTPAVRRGLASLLAQEGVARESWFVIRDADDPAARAVEEAIRGRSEAHLLVAGPAAACCQKNHSLLAGIRAAGDVDILVFCDSGHVAAPDFLARLLAPVFRGETVLSTTHRRVVPGDGRLATLAHYFSALAVMMLPTAPLRAPPWGGATAIRRKTFVDEGLEAVWARGVVDDFTLGPHLARRGIRALPVPEACPTTPLSGQTWGAWADWWTRQLFYLKFCMPLAWLAATLAPLTAGAVLAGACWTLCAGLFGGFDSGALASAAYLGLLAALGPLFGSLSESRRPPWRWALAFVLMQALSVACYARTWTTNTLTWRGIRYKARLDGSVAAVLRDPDHS